MEIKSRLLQNPTKKPFRLTKETRFQFNVSMDLTKRRYNLLIKAKGLITKTPQLQHTPLVMLIVRLF